MPGGTGTRTPGTSASAISSYGSRASAVATSVSHDSHNIIVVGTNDLDMAFAVNHIAQQHGGIAVVSEQQVLGNLPLEIAGIMSGDTLVHVNEKLEAAKEAAYRLESTGKSGSFMTLFMALPVIP
ncbi:MAG: adenine deaminase C-terminal domain-containing protein [Oscillospiraceae bacterium]